MDVERGYHGATSWAGAMAGTNITCDRFTCPHIKLEWHEQATNIMIEAENTSSPSLKKILERDAHHITDLGLFNMGIIFNK